MSQGDKDTGLDGAALQEQLEALLSQIKAVEPDLVPDDGASPQTAAASSSKDEAAAVDDEAGTADETTEDGAATEVESQAQSAQPQQAESPAAAEKDQDQGLDDGTGTEAASEPEMQAAAEAESRAAALEDGHEMQRETGADDDPDPIAAVDNATEAAESLEQQLDALLNEAAMDGRAAEAQTDTPAEEATFEPEASTGTDGAAADGQRDHALEESLQGLIDEALGHDPADPASGMSAEGADDGLTSQHEEEAGTESDTKREAVPEAELDAQSIIDQQVQSLLNEATGEEAETSAAVDAPAASPEGEASQDGGSPEEVEELDEQLAETAEELLAGDFASADDVLGGAQSATGDALLPESHTDAMDATIGAGTDPPPSPQHEENADLPDGSFRSPDELIGAGAAGEPEAPSSKAADEATSGEARGSTKSVQLSLKLPRLPDLSGIATILKRVPPVVLQVCRVLNQPVLQLSPQWQQIIGYAGLITLANALILLLISLLR